MNIEDPKGIQTHHNLRTDLRRDAKSQHQKGVTVHRAYSTSETYSLQRINQLNNLRQVVTWSRCAEQEAALDVIPEGGFPNPKQTAKSKFNQLQQAKPLPKKVTPSDLTPETHATLQACRNKIWSTTKLLLEGEAGSPFWGTLSNRVRGQRAV